MDYLWVMVKYVISAFCLLFWTACVERTPAVEGREEDKLVQDTTSPVPAWDTVVVARDVPIKCYFEFLDTLVRRYDTLLPYTLTEHILIWANPWIIDTLVETDYYRQIDRGIFVYNQKDMVVLKQGDTLFIPGTDAATAIQAALDSVHLDVNIPEFLLRIHRGSDTLFTFPVRVGQNRSRYLAMSKRTTDLRTAIGRGSIVYINKNPSYINPVDNKVYKVTRRDDERVTLVPRIPWMEPEIGGRRLGHFIHPTTNPITLGKAYSNGCVGTREGDAWRIYYHSPVGTKLHFRYDLQVVGPDGDTLKLRDVYGYGVSAQQGK
jgi:L,D-transpeptidase ErfK/SrfK